MPEVSGCSTGLWVPCAGTPMASHDHLTPLAILPDLATAQLFSARLDAAGITARLRGEALGPYRFTFGAMAATQVWVAEDDMQEALELLHDAGLAEFAEPRSADQPPTRVPLILGVIGFVALVLLVRLLLLL